MIDLAKRPDEGAKKSWWRSGWSIALLSGLIGVLIGAVGVAASSGYFVRRTIVANPEIVQEAIEALQAREMANIVAPRRAALETPFHGAWAGAREPDVVLVEFFDYACGYCRVSNPHVDRLLREDPKLRVVWREFPVLGPDSEAAAVASLAAARAGGTGRSSTRCLLRGGRRRRPWPRRGRRWGLARRCSTRRRGASFRRISIWRGRSARRGRRRSSLEIRCCREPLGMRRCGMRWPRLVRRGTRVRRGGGRRFRPGPSSRPFDCLRGRRSG